MSKKSARRIVAERAALVLAGAVGYTIGYIIAEKCAIKGSAKATDDS